MLIAFVVVEVAAAADSDSDSDSDPDGSASVPVPWTIRPFTWDVYQRARDVGYFRGRSGGLKTSVFKMSQIQFGQVRCRKVRIIMKQREVAKVESIRRVLR